MKGMDPIPLRAAQSSPPSRPTILARDRAISIYLVGSGDADLMAPGDDPGRSCVLRMEG